MAGVAYEISVHLDWQQPKSKLPTDNPTASSRQGARPSGAFYRWGWRVAQRSIPGLDALIATVVFSYVQSVTPAYSSLVVKADLVPRYIG